MVVPVFEERVDVLGETLLSIAAQTVPVAGVTIVTESFTPRGMTALDAVRRRYADLIPTLRVTPSSSRLAAGMLVDVVAPDLAGLEDAATHFTIVHAGDVLFDHWAATAIDALEGAPTPKSTVVRMRFVRQLVGRTPRGAPYAVSMPIRPYADAYDPARHEAHSQTPSSAAVLPVRTVTAMPNDHRDPGWTGLRMAAEAGTVVDASEITSLVRAWHPTEWVWMERDCMERCPQ